MGDGGSITLWIEQLKAGDRAAAQPLWERYYRRLVGLARKKLGEMPRQASDEEDVVQSAFNSFFQRAKAGQFPRLHDRDDLWPLLVVIAARKALNQRVRQQCAKRGKGRAIVSLDAGAGQFSGNLLGEIIGSEPTPEIVAEVSDLLERIMNRLDDPSLRLILLWKLEGRTNVEVSRELTISVAAVERKIRKIRELVETEF